MHKHELHLSRFKQYLLRVHNFKFPVLKRHRAAFCYCFNKLQQYRILYDKSQRIENLAPAKTNSYTRLVFVLNINIVEYD